MTGQAIIILIVIAVIAALVVVRSRRPRVTQIDRTIVRKDEGGD